MHRPLALLIFLALAAPLPAQEATPDQLEAIETEQEISAERLQELKAEVAEALKQEDELQQKIEAAAKSYDAKIALVAKSEAALIKLKEEEIIIRSDLTARREVLAEVLAGLQRLEQNPPPALVVNPDDVLGALRSAMMFGAIVPEMKDEALALTKKLDRLKKVKEETQALRVKANDDLASLDTTKSELDNLLSKKSRARGAAEKSLAETEARLRGLAAKAQDLKQLLAAIEAEKARDAEELSARAAAEAKAKTEEATRLEQALRTPKLSMADAQGRLDYPAEGRIVRHFGEDNGLGSPLAGLAIATGKRALVKSPVDGKLEFAGRFRSFGEMVIINPGQDYLVLLAGLGKISAKAGQSVRRGEPLGIMGEDKSSVSLLDLGGAGISGENPILYLEFRHKGLAIDSAPFWVAYRKEAQE